MISIFLIKIFVLIKLLFCLKLFIVVYQSLSFLKIFFCKFLKKLFVSLSSRKVQFSFFEKKKDFSFGITWFKDFIINKIKINILILLFGDEYCKIIQDNKEEKLSSLIVYSNFRDFKFEAEYGWNSLNNEKIHDLFESGVRFKILIDSCEIMNFFTVREFTDFMCVLSSSLREKKFIFFKNFFVFKKCEKTLENMNQFLIDLYFISWDEEYYNFESEE